MSLSGSNHRLHARSYAPYPTDLQTGYAEQVSNGGRYRRGFDPIRICEQAQAERDITEDGAEDCGSMADEPGPISATRRADLYEARIII